MKKVIILVIHACLFCGFLSAQPNSAVPAYIDPTTTDFKTIQNQVEQFFEGKDQGRGTGYKQWKRWEYYTQNRLSPDGQIINYAAHKNTEWRKYKKSKPDYVHQPQRSNSGSWSQLAPTDGYLLGPNGYNPGLGRVNVIAFHPTSGNTVFVGTAGGGLWKTTNAGTSWFPLTDGIPRLGVSGVVVHPSNPNIIYILTGDGDGGDTPCYGVLKTYDGGDSWEETGLTFSQIGSTRGYKLVMDPSNSNTLIAATTAGLYRTTNAGNDWTVESSGSFRDIEYKPGTPSTVYATTSNTFRRSLNGGDTWTTISTGLPTGESRAAIAVTPDDPSCVYYFAGPGGPTGSYKGLYRSNNSGTSWVTRHTSPNILDSNLNGMNDCSDGCDQSTYDLAIAVDPDDASTILTGGVNLWRSTNFGTSFNIQAHWSWGTTSEYVHADIHELVYNPLNGQLWCGSDGGAFRSIDDGANWTDRSSVGSDNGLQNMQFYRIAGIASNANILIGGTQDNGSNRWNGGNDVTHYDGADGMDCMIASGNSNIQYHCRQNGGLRKSTNGGSSHSSIRPGNSNGAWVTPIEMAPTNDNELWAGYRDTIYRSTNAGSSWTRLIPEFSGERFVYIHHTESNSNRVYAATSNNMYRTDDNGSNWTEITSGLIVGGTNITSIATDVNNSSQVWVTLSGTVDGQKVYFSSTSGASWTNVSGSLPNVATNIIIYDARDNPDNSLYVGNDLGVFYKDGTMNDWVPYRNGLPNVEIFDLEINVAGDDLRAGTFGRGIWTSNLYSTCPSAYSLTDNNFPGTGLDGYRQYQASTSVTSTRSIPGSFGTEVWYQAGNFISLGVGFRAEAGMDLFAASIGPCGAGVPEALIIWPNDEQVYSFNNDSPDSIPTEANSETIELLKKDAQLEIVFNLEEDGPINLCIADKSGKVIESLIHQEYFRPGQHSISIGKLEMEGDYLLILKSNKTTFLKKIVLL